VQLVQCHGVLLSAIYPVNAIQPHYIPIHRLNQWQGDEYMYFPVLVL
jgi:hypothetical protein